MVQFPYPDPDGTAYYNEAQGNLPYHGPLTTFEQEGTGANDYSGSLYPDGAYAEYKRTPGYLVDHNFDQPEHGFYEGRRGWVAFWAKHNFDMGNPTTMRKLFGGAGKVKPGGTNPNANPHFAEIKYLPNMTNDEEDGRANGIAGAVGNWGWKLRNHNANGGASNRWTPTHSFMADWIWQKPGWAWLYQAHCTSFAVTRDYANAENSKVRGTATGFNFASNRNDFESLYTGGNANGLYNHVKDHTWNVYAISWDYVGANTVEKPPFCLMSINGRHLHSAKDSKWAVTNNTPPSKVTSNLKQSSGNAGSVDLDGNGNGSDDGTKDDDIIKDDGDIIDVIPILPMGPVAFKLIAIPIDVDVIGIDPGDIEPAPVPLPVPIVPPAPAPGSAANIEGENNKRTYAGDPDTAVNKAGGETIFHNEISFMQDYFSFGAMPAINGNYTHISPYYADSTIDEVFCGRTNMWRDQSVGNDKMLFNAGRYWNMTYKDLGNVDTLANYVSPEINVHQTLNYVGGGLLTLRSVSWDYYRAVNNRWSNTTIPADHNATSFPDLTTRDTFIDNLQGVEVNPNDTADPMTRYWAADIDIDEAEKMSWDPVSVDFRMPESKNSEWEDDGWFFEESDMSKRLTYAGGSTLDEEAMAKAGYAATDTFQFKFYFHMANSQQIYESPVFDGFTATFKPGRPVIMLYETSQSSK
jgi:hypothetical protein